MRCEDCDGICRYIDDVCMIGECDGYEHLLYDKGGSNYGCRLQRKTVEKLIDGLCRWTSINSKEFKKAQQILKRIKRYKNERDII